MKKIIKLCIIAEGYPTQTDPLNTFIEQLILEFADLGIDCTVVNPQSITRILFRRTEIRPKYREQLTKKGNKIEIISRYYVSASTRRIGPLNTSCITLKGFIQACRRSIQSEKFDFDALYGHFIFTSGITAAELSRKYGIPAFFAYGENTNYSIDYLGLEKTRKLLRGIKGVVAVSTENKNILIRQELAPEKDIGVFVNSINDSLFYPRDKQLMRKKYSLPPNDFIIIFVGRFVEIKGANRLSAAIKKIGISNIKSIFLGGGAVGPDNEGILLKGEQPHSKVPELLSAADVFVLPTLAEGCSNAIVEAMACGLPIISSNRPFNDDILDETCSIRIDPENVDAIANAINHLYHDTNLQQRLSNGALNKAKQLNIKTRAKNIVEFMESKL